MNSKEAIEAIKANYPPAQYTMLREALDLAIKALEQQVFFENEVSNIMDWFVDNKDEMLNSAISVANSWKVDLDFMAEDIVDAIQIGVLNALSTYKGS